MTDDFGSSSGRWSPGEPFSVDALFAAASLPPLPLEENPAARILGLVPEPEHDLDGDALKKARTDRHLTVSQVANKLTAAGWEVRPADVFRWESRSASDVVPALVAAVAVAIGVPSSDLIRSRPSRSRLETLRDSDRFQELARRWAGMFGMTVHAASLALEARTAATVHRGHAPDTEQTLRTLEALVDGVERRTQR